MEKFTRVAKLRRLYIYKRGIKNRPDYIRNENLYFFMRLCSVYWRCTKNKNHGLINGI